MSFRIATDAEMSDFRGAGILLLLTDDIRLGMAISNVRGVTKAH